MYTSYFGFDSKPFKPRDPREFYRNADFDAACAAILQGIRARQGFLLLTGEAGLGKSLTLRRCMAEADDVRFILLGNAHLDFPDILNYLCADLGLLGGDLDAEQQNQRLRDALVEYANRGQAVALLIDDAHHLRVDVLRRLWEFVEGLAVAADQRPRVVLAGLPELEGKLQQPELRPIQESLRVRYRLERLSEVETSLFIAHQLGVAGRTDGSLLSPAVVERVTHYCQGKPRAIALLCDAVLLFASLQSEREIVPAMVDEAAQICFLGDYAEASSLPAGTAPPGRPGGGDEFDVAATGSDLDFSFDFAPEETQAAERSIAATAVEAMPTAPVEAPAAAPAPQPAVADAGSTPAPLEPIPGSPPAVLPPLRAFLQLLDEIAVKQDRQGARNREAFREFRHRYQWLARGGPPLWLAQYEQRMTRLADNKQPVLAALAVTPHAAPEPGGVLCALLMNPTWWLYREIRVRMRSTDLEFANRGQTVSLRLLDGRDAQPVYLEYQWARAEPGPATLQLELDLLDHRGAWHAYRGPAEIRLIPASPGRGWLGREQGCRARAGPRPILAGQPRRRGPIPPLSRGRSRLAPAAWPSRSLSN